MNGYNAYIKVYLEGAKGTLCSKTPGDAKKKLSAWVESFRKAALRNFNSYNSDRQDDISDENTRHVVISENGHKLVDGTTDPYNVSVASPSPGWFSKFPPPFPTSDCK